jgi:hypothetical protein
MMTARHLVRRLLELRRSRATLSELALQVGYDLGQQAQSGIHADFGLAVHIDNKMPEAQGQHATVKQAGFDNHFTGVQGNIGGLSNQHGFALDQHGPSGQSFNLGQQSSLLGQNGTVSGFWVPFKRRAA